MWTTWDFQGSSGMVNDFLSPSIENTFILRKNNVSLYENS